MTTRQFLKSLIGIPMAVTAIKSSPVSEMDYLANTLKEIFPIPAVPSHLSESELTYLLAELNRNIYQSTGFLYASTSHDHKT